MTWATFFHPTGLTMFLLWLPVFSAISWVLTRLLLGICDGADASTRGPSKSFRSGLKAKGLSPTTASEYLKTFELPRELTESGKHRLLTDSGPHQIP